MRDVHLLSFTRQRECSASHFLRGCDPFAVSQEKDCINGVWIIDVIGRDARRIGRAARLRGKHFIKEAALLDIAGEHFPFVDVLIANR